MLAVVGVCSLTYGVNSAHYFVAHRCGLAKSYLLLVGARCVIVAVVG